MHELRILVHSRLFKARAPIFCFIRFWLRDPPTLRNHSYQFQSYVTYNIRASNLSCWRRQSCFKINGVCMPSSFINIVSFCNPVCWYHLILVVLEELFDLILRLFLKAKFEKIVLNIFSSKSNNLIYLFFRWVNINNFKTHFSRLDSTKYVQKKVKRTNCV